MADCPVHGVEMIYSPARDEWACQNPDCVHGHGVRIRETRYGGVECLNESSSTERSTRLSSAFPTDGPELLGQEQPSAPAGSGNAWSAALPSWTRPFTRRITTWGARYWAWHNKPCECKGCRTGDICEMMIW